MVSSSKEMLPPLPSVGSVFASVSSSAESQAVWKNKDIRIPEVKIELKHWTGPRMVDSLFMFIVCDVGLCFFFIFCIVVNSLNVDCCLFFGVMKKSVGSIYASGQ